jgi:putative transposase
MSRIPRLVTTRKRKSRRLGEVEVVERGAYQELELEAKVELIRSLVPLGLMHVSEMLEDEVAALAGERYARKSGAEVHRYGTNPGSVRLAGQRVPIAVPRVRGTRGEVPLRSYQLFQEQAAVNDTLLRRVLFGISCRNYEAAAEAIPGAIGLSSSSVSRAFVEASAGELRQFQERDLRGVSYVALFLDGKTFADQTMVIALGVQASGEKQFLGFVETTTENESVLTAFLRSLMDRGLDVSEGILVVLDGGKGLRAAVRKVFARRAVVQRCMWHKRENVVSHLPRNEQGAWRRRLQLAYNRPTEAEARKALERIHRELLEHNQSAAASLAEGLEETLTLHRLGLAALLGRSFRTTNVLESVNALVEERCAKVDAWKNSHQRQRWLATALLDIEPRLRKVLGCLHLPKLQEAIKKELNIERSEGQQKRKAA